MVQSSSGLRPSQLREARHKVDPLRRCIQSFGGKHRKKGLSPKVWMKWDLIQSLYMNLFSLSFSLSFFSPSYCSRL